MDLKRPTNKTKALMCLGITISTITKKIGKDLLPTKLYRLGMNTSMKFGEYMRASGEDKHDEISNDVLKVWDGSGFSNNLDMLNGEDILFLAYLSDGINHKEFEKMFSISPYTHLSTENICDDKGTEIRSMANSFLLLMYAVYDLGKLVYPIKVKKVKVTKQEMREKKRLRRLKYVIDKVKEKHKGTNNE